MADTILDTMDSWKRIAGNADADGSFTPFTQDRAAVEAVGRVATAIGQLMTVMQTISNDTKATLTALTGIRARLDAGINTKTVTTLANVTL